MRFFNPLKVSEENEGGFYLYEVNFAHYLNSMPQEGKCKR